MPLDDATRQRFWSKVRQSDGCWEWTACRTTAGYGKFRLDGQHLGAHRISYLLEYGDIPDGLWVLHDCDNPGCVRPDHLYLGTHADNVRDRVARKRDSYGDRNGSRLHPERILRGDNHPFRKNPSLVARGERSPVHRHPELYRGENHGFARLTIEQVREIRRVYAAGGITAKILGKQYGVSISAIYSVVKRETWKLVE